MLGVKRLIAGIILIVVGFLSFMATVPENTFIHNPDLTINVPEIMESIFFIMIESVMIAIGVILTASGIRNK